MVSFKNDHAPLDQTTLHKIKQKNYYEMSENN